MKINQAFTTLQKAGGIRAARIITKDKNKIPTFKVLWMAHQLRRGVPVAKIIHEKWFYGLPFYTNRHTLDPRPDSETLVSAALADTYNNNPVRVLDLGTGTGCLIASIVKNVQNSSGVAVEKSRGAAHVARRNIIALGLGDKISIMRRSFDDDLTIGRFDIIVSNPPYIAHDDDRVDSGAMHDPKMALYADNNGLAAYEIIAKRAIDWIKPDGKIYLEIGIDQGNAVRKIFENMDWKFMTGHNDICGTERVLCFSK